MARVKVPAWLARVGPAAAGACVLRGSAGQQGGAAPRCVWCCIASLGVLLARMVHRKGHERGALMCRARYNLKL